MSSENDNNLQPTIKQMSVFFAGEKGRPRFFKSKGKPPSFLVKWGTRHIQQDGTLNIMQQTIVDKVNQEDNATT